MIKHFLVRDFRDSMVVWIIFSAIIILLTVSFVLGPNNNPIFIMGFLCLMFSMFQSTGLMGTVVRSDHIMSRHYYLTLPIGRQRVFSLIIFRLSIFYLPLWIFCTVIAPLTLSSEFNQIRSSVSCYLTYVLGVSLGILWFLGHLLHQTVIWEQSLHYLSSRKRVLSALLPSLISAVEIGIIFMSFYFAIEALTQSEKISPSFTVIKLIMALIFPLFLTLVKLRLARNRWICLG